ncbi:hypothetical protein ACWDZ6_18240 [Streptomyces sp. NPDC002926]
MAVRKNRLSAYTVRGSMKPASVPDRDSHAEGRPLTEPAPGGVGAPGYCGRVKQPLYGPGC